MIDHVDWSLIRKGIKSDHISAAISEPKWNQVKVNGNEWCLVDAFSCQSNIPLKQSKIRQFSSISQDALTDVLMTLSRKNVSVAGKSQNMTNNLGMAFRFEIFSLGIVSFIRILYWNIQLKDYICLLIIFTKALELGLSLLEGVSLIIANIIMSWSVDIYQGN